MKELEKSRANIAEKTENTERQQDKILLITNAAGDKSPLNTKWMRDGEIDDDDFTIVRSIKKEKRR